MKYHGSIVTIVTTVIRKELEPTDLRSDIRIRLNGSVRRILVVKKIKDKSKLII